jgi:putative membrane protein
MKRSVSRLALAACSAAIALAPWAAAQQSANRITAEDHNFAVHAAQGGLAEVKLGLLAQQRAESPAVKDFASRMVTDHTKLNADLKTIAEKDGIPLPTGLTARDQATYDRLSKLSGADFDRAYMRSMVTDHKADIVEFKRQADHGFNPAMKQFASNAMPTLQEHLKMAEQAQGQVKGEK